MSHAIIIDGVENEFSNDSQQRKTDPKTWLRFVGLFAAEDLEEMSEAIADCEGIENGDTWLFGIG